MSLFATAESKTYLAERARLAADAETPPPMTPEELLAECDAILAATERARRSEERARRDTPVIRLHTSEWALAHIVGDPLAYSFEWVENDTGMGSTTHLAEAPEARWLVDIWGRVERGEGEAPFITADYVGGRWGGCLDDVHVEETSTGDQIVVATWCHDYEKLKWIYCWPTPWSPAALQGKAWMMVGPSDWCGLATLMMNLHREHNSLITLPDDPLDFSQYGPGLDLSEWPVVVNPRSFELSAIGGALWSMPIIRMKTWHDAFAAILADAELSVQCDRWLEGDDEPWPGAGLRHGTLVISIVDKSGRYHGGTSERGNLFTGLQHTVREFASDFIDTTLVSVSGQPMPDEYLQIGVKSTHRSMPYVILQPGITPGVLSADFGIRPAKGIQILTGGKSMPGVNEAISAIIQAIGDIVGDNLTVQGYGVGSIGGAIDTLLKPFYENTILAWTATKSFQRAQNAGWDRYFEFFQDGADQAYTLASLMAIRTGLWATRRRFTHEVKIIDACPWMVGDNGVGHMWLSDRVGTTEPGDTSGRVWLDRIIKLTLSADETTFHPEWDVVIGGEKDSDPFMTAVGRIKETVTQLHDLGLAA
ncbi:hypothetical protein C6V83_18040 [Gordonia iterans]|uniref:Gp28/Gp37-like domain-containing protein n=1 Tax=Gordonia iterans TaxID=1004901 RepID=A0A2S0KJK9_9ACTN|nr:hypothetical protein [Gordonia iterans]AVM01879.1 hypothetical protein C6V83_18040 [Gordonia iterans]